MPESLLQTKLYTPPLRPNLVRRTRLIDRLELGIQHSKKLSLISAPAGFGKTTLVTDWVGSQRLDETTENKVKYCFAWLSLDENDNDPTRFLTYFVGALQTIEANIGQGTLGILQSSQAPSIEAVLTSIINDVTAIPDRIILVLDDYHLIESTPIDESLAFLLKHLPPQMHLVITTRADPHLPLARLRARGQLTELRAADLRFSPAETTEFLNQVMALGLSAADITALENRTEGWIAGLQLAAISLQGREDATRLIKSFTGSHRYVLDYLIEEVLQQQPERVQEFLLKTAIVDRLVGSLCDALTGQDDGQETLEMLEQANLFVVSLDNERLWYRYHHLFVDLLRHRLQQTNLEQIPALHGRASEWYEGNGRPADSIRHAISAEDFERAADLAELAWPAHREGIQSIIWLGWLKALPDELVRARPVLSAGYAWAFLNSGQLEAAEARLRDSERWLEQTADQNEQSGRQPAEMVVVDEEEFRSLPLTLAAARAYHAQAIDDVAGTVKYTRRVLNLSTKEDQQWRGAASSLLGLALYASGDLEEAYQNFSAGLADMDPLEAMTGTFVLAEIKMAQGQLRAATRLCELSLQLATEHGEPMPMGTEDVYTGLSKLHRELGNLEAAAQDLVLGKEVGEAIELPDWQHRWYVAQARLQETLGELAGALDLLDEAERRHVRTPVPDLQPIAALRARIWIAQGRMVEAVNWAHERELSADDELSYMREFEHLTLARVLMARYKRDQASGFVHEAITLLERLLQAAEEAGRIGSVIEILVLLALVYEAQGRSVSALTSLERALALAEPEGYQRIFLDEGPPMVRLLNQALARGTTPDYTRRLLAALPLAEKEETGSVRKQELESQLVEPLSERETEVLQLISEGLTNREIASRLYLSLHTVKVHNRNIFVKLDVHHRAAAVAQARALGILRST